MQNNNNNPNKGRRYIPGKGYNNASVQEQEQPRTYLSNLFKPPSDPDEAKAEQERLYGRTPNNTKISSTFTI